MKTKKSISFIENPEELSQLDMNSIRGGVNAADCGVHCTHCSGSSTNSTTTRPVEKEILPVC